MSEMIERVAKAIQTKSSEYDRLPLNICIEYANAAIEAMREPTEEMCFAPDRSGIGDDGPESKEIYKAMIDAALK